MTVRLLPMGPLAVLVEDPPGDPARFALGIAATGPPGLVDVVPAARTVLVRCDSPASLAALAVRLPSVEPLAAGVGADEVTVPVRYDGPDLDHVAAEAALSPADVVELHAAATYEVAFCGFAPGFAYLRGLPEALHLPRRSTPRTRVPAGSVAIAAGYAAVYPGASPGGWHLLGRTELRLFDVDRDPPALLRPGTTVRFEVVLDP